MKILYRQNVKSEMKKINIENAYLKEISLKKDYKNTTLKSHYHTEYEIHMIFCGNQCYEIDGVKYEIKKNEFILISPKTRHRMVSASQNLLKYSITFNSADVFCKSSCCGEMSEEIVRSMSFITEEFKKNMPSSPLLIENRVYEVLVMLIRIIGHEKVSQDTKTQTQNNRIELAKRFISDNIEQRLSVGDVASYCHISTRQLARIFLDIEGVSPAGFINSERMKKIGECVQNSDMSLQQISELFSFNNEYYFNTAFKKYFGMPPFSYRKMFR